MRISKSSWHSKITGDLGEALVLYWLSKHGFECARVDHTGNDAVKLDATVLYADLADSTRLVDDRKPRFAAERYKAYLHATAKIIRSEGGTINAYDGDRIMAVFIGDLKNTSSARAALKINYAVNKIINPAIKNQYPDTTYVLGQTVGIDTSELFVARTGIRGSNDLVWMGRAANHEAKLSDLSADYPTRITAAVYERLQEDVKFSDGKARWEERSWTAMDNQIIYRSSWKWAI